MGERGGPALANSYAANVTVAILALFPGLINTSALALLAPSIGRDLGAGAPVAGLALYSDAGLAFGCVLAAELARRVEGRAWWVALIVLSGLCSLASALAPSFAVLLAVNVVHGLVAGMLFIATLPPLLLTFGSARLPTTANVLVPGLFGAGAIGPVVAAFTTGHGAWRGIFAAEAAIAVATLALGALTIAPRPPKPTAAPVDVTALAIAAAGAALIFAGAGRFAGAATTDLRAVVPLALGIAAFLALLVVEYRNGERALIPVRPLFGSLALVGAIATMVASAGFSATLQAVTLALERVAGDDVHATGLALWPGAVAALAAGFAFARIVTTRWVVVAGAAGVAILGAGALAAWATPIASTAGWIVLVAGFGAGLSVTPGLFLITLSFERHRIPGAIALLNLFRLTLGFMSGPGVAHTIGSRTIARLAEHGIARSPETDASVRAFITGRPLVAPIPPDALRAALAGGIHDGVAIVVGLCALGLAATALVLLRAHVPLRAPDLAAFDAGHPALASPPLR